MKHAAQKIHNLLPSLKKAANSRVLIIIPKYETIITMINIPLNQSYYTLRMIMTKQTAVIGPSTL